MKRQPRSIPVAWTLLLTGAVALTSCVPPGPPENGPSAEASAEKDDDEPFEKWEEVLEDTEEIEGFLTFHKKRDGTLLLELAPDRLGEEFGLLMHYSRGVGDFNLQQGLPLSQVQLMRLRRVHDKVQLVHVNERFTATPGSRLARALQENVGHSVVAAWDIQSEHDSTKHVLVDVTKWLVSDYAGVSEQLGFYYGGKPVNLDSGRSNVGRILAFPKNVEIDAELTFSAGSPPVFGGYGVSDHRSIPVGVRYSLFALPEQPMHPRPADDRVGYFLTAHWDFSRDQEEEAFVRFADRWRLEKKDPDAALSEPVQPIVYYVDRSVPERYRQYVKEGIEAWNKGFEAAGFRDAIVARDPPADSAWSAEDVRYSTVRWTPGYNMGYAIGPSQVDPRTGEILNADILISANWPRFWLTEYQEMVGRPAGAPERAGTPHGAPADGPGGDLTAGTGLPAGAGGGLESLIRDYERARWMAAGLGPLQAQRLCTAAIGKARQAALGYAALVALGEVEVGEMPEEYVGGAIRELVMHEVGHTLGLRHNFKASSAVPFDRLHDREFTRKNGVSVSVMDYNPVNLAADRSRQGYYWIPEVGSYDVWAIRYGYSVYPGASERASRTPDAGAPATPGDGAPATTGGRALATPGEPSGGDGGDFMETARMARAGIPDEEREWLKEIASEASDPLHAYGTDQDAGIGTYAIDPLANAYDLSDDPLEYARNQARIVAAVQPRLEERLIAEGEAFYRLRSAMTGMIFERFRSLFPLAKNVGGLYFARDHKGDPDGRSPFTPVTADRQREAVRFLVDQALDEDAFEFDPELLNKLAPNTFWHWGVGFFQLPVDYPVHSYVLLVQRAIVNDLLAPPRLWRMLDNETRMPEGTEFYPASELFTTLTGAIWSELGLDASGRVTGRARPATSFRRNLQRVHLDRLIDLLLDRVGGFLSSSTPEDARSLARHELGRLSHRMGQALRTGGLDTMTRAHLEESKARIDRALEASLELGEER